VTLADFDMARAKETPPVEGHWQDGPWAGAPVLEVASFHPQSSAHRPPTRVKVLWDDRRLYLRFRVEDRYVLCRHTARQAPVCQDSCVEAFIAPGNDGSAGYFNFEVNCGGALLLHHVRDPAFVDGGFADCEVVEARWLDRIAIYTSLPGPLEPEVNAPITWEAAWSIPWELFEAMAGVSPPTAGDIWRGNFYKCADLSSHPHWGSWAPIGSEKNFHQPDRFGSLGFVE